MSDVVVQNGYELTENLIQFMTDTRIREYGKNTKDFRNNEKESKFFFLYEGQNIKAFAMLKPVVLYYRDREYPIMGLANVISITKGRGYGSRIIGSVTDYLRKNHIPTIGNTWKGNFEFYKKCGYRFVPNLINRLTYQNPKGINEKTESENYDMFAYDSDNKLSELLNGNDEIFIRVPFW